VPQFDFESISDVVCMANSYRRLGQGYEIARHWNSALNKNCFKENREIRYPDKAI
jgi:hypothetical protein